MVIIDGIVRLIPGVLSDLDSALGDSFTCGLLDSAYYTRPETLRGESVPKVLLSGNHEEIRKWRRRDALLQTLKRRPDLLKRSELDRDDVRFLAGHGWSGKTDH
jgi:tRNA (guanine37-N1)-methyltransferase